MKKIDSEIGVVVAIAAFCGNLMRMRAGPCQKLGSPSNQNSQRFVSQLMVLGRANPERKHLQIFGIIGWERVVPTFR